jgi:hypothetical protein
MKWLFLTGLLVLAIGCCSCTTNYQGQAPVDPFYGHMTVPPPGTGAIGPPPTAPYYPPVAPGGPAALQPVPQTPTAPSYQQYQAPPPGGGQYQAPPPGGAVPIPQTPAGPMPGPGAGGNWTNPRSGTTTSWTGEAHSGPGDVITIPVSESSAPPGAAPVGTAGGS